MSRVRGATPLVLLGVALTVAGVGTAAPRIHRTTLPPPVLLPTQITVDETEWSVRPSKRFVAAGQVRVQVYNRGMDDHDLVIQDADGTRRHVDMPPRSEAEMVVTLTPGRHKVWCSLFEGTPAAHEGLGMVTFIEALPQRGAAASTARRRPLR